ncbi:MAG TPA: hypothetical protein ENN13_02690 [Candidatus Altiarchaeales archaeon]|mgnify:CR=1 FL=1|nr:hypothetical protein [Candidatus Altiarchaeales archaeon]
MEEQEPVMEEITPRQLVERLIEKHDRFISDYENSVEGAKRLHILREKKDQLEHWVADGGGEMFEKQFQATVKELADLEKSMISTELSQAQMTARLDDHKGAKKYWVKKLEEMGQ